MIKASSVAPGCIIALLAVCAAAQAADLGRPAYQTPASAMASLPYNWKGFYVGANLGGTWADAQVTNTFTGVSWTDSQSRFTGGFQSGYNYQAGNFVLGLEGGFNWLNLSTGSQQFTVPAMGTFSASASTDWVATLAGRLGFASDRWLIYGKLGGAWINGSSRVANLATAAAVKSSDTATGWLVGGGVEYGLAQNWSARLAYDYIAMDDRNGAGPVGNSNIKVSNDIQMLTLGINYKF